MKKKTLATAVAITTLTFAGASAAASPGTSATTSPEQKRGAASGLVIGAIAGGPAGAFIGAVLGGEVFGTLFEQKRVNRELNAEVVALQSTLSNEQQRFAETTDALNSDIDRMISINAGQVQGRQLPVQFRTGSSTIEPQYGEELKAFARLLKRNQDATVTLTGFADRRGDNEANLALSEQRADAVMAYLMAGGVSKSQIITIAYGETRPLSPQESLEANFFDRRVVVELNLDITSQLATR